MKKILFITYSVFSFFLLALSGRGYGATYAYVSNSYDNTVSVIHTSDNTVTTTVDVGEWPYGVAVSPDGEYVYVSAIADGTANGVIIDPSGLGSASSSESESNGGGGGCFIATAAHRPL